MSRPQTVLILGATGGIGSQLCRRLAIKGTQLVMAARDPAKLAALASEVNGVPITIDATKSSEVQDCFDQALEIFGSIDGVVNCVGSLLLKPAHITTDDEWDQVIATNLTSAFATVKSAGKAMLRTGGSIVLVSSAAGQVGLVNHEAIAAAKAGVIGLTRSAAATYAGRGIRVNCVAPGLVRTPLTERITSNQAMLQASLDMHPLGRIGEPADVAAAIEWLLSPENNWITGQVLGVDGGLASLRSRSAA